MVTVTLFPCPEGVTVSGEDCTETRQETNFPLRRIENPKQLFKAFPFASDRASGHGHGRASIM